MTAVIVPKLRSPIVLVHGLLGYGRLKLGGWTIASYFAKIPEFLSAAGNRVLVASAYLDKEKLGERALFCLDSETGAIRWQTPLKVNPWGGPSVSGETVVISGSTIGYDPKALKGARGEVAAFSLADGKEKWHKELPGGVLSCVALADGLAVATTTDGKVRAFDLASGERHWIYESKAPFFAAPAVA